MSATALDVYRLDYRRTTAALAAVKAVRAFTDACAEYDQAEAACIAQAEEMVEQVPWPDQPLDMHPFDD